MQTRKIRLKSFYFARPVTLPPSRWHCAHNHVRVSRRLITEEDGAGRGLWLRWSLLFLPTSARIGSIQSESNTPCSRRKSHFLPEGAMAPGLFCVVLLLAIAAPCISCEFASNSKYSFGISLCWGTCPCLWTLTPVCFHGVLHLGDASDVIMANDTSNVSWSYR